MLGNSRSDKSLLLVGGQGGLQGGGQGLWQGGGGQGFAPDKVEVLLTVELLSQVSPHLRSTNITSPPILIMFFSGIYSLLLSKSFNIPRLHLPGTTIPTITPCGKEN